MIFSVNEQAIVDDEHVSEAVAQLRQQAFSFVICRRSGTDPLSCGLSACEYSCDEQEVWAVTLAEATRVLNEQKVHSINDLYPGEGSVQEAMENLLDVVDAAFVGIEHDVNCGITEWDGEQSYTGCTCGLERSKELIREQLDQGVLQLVNALQQPKGSSLESELASGDTTDWLE